MQVINFFAMVGMVINNLLALQSLLGSVILLFGSFAKASLRSYGKVAEWSIVGLVFGLLFQISMAITHTTPEQIGFLIPMSALMVDALLGVSLLMLVGRWLIRKTLRREITIRAR
jgi:hypothetical protein